MNKSDWVISVTMEIMENVLEESDLEVALNNSLRLIVDVLGCEAGIIWMLNKDRKILHPIYHIGPSDISNVTVENGIGVEGRATQSGEKIIINDSKTDSRFEATVFDDQVFKTRNMICLPLVDIKDVIGCIQLINKKTDENYSQEEIKLCDRLAHLAAMTIVEKGLVINDEEKKKVQISLRNVKKEFAVGEDILHILNGINLDIYENEFIVVLGESGCGKSTMMNIIGGMDTLTEGEVLVDGNDMSNYSEKELTKYRRNYVGFIFQSYNLMPNLTSLENVQFLAEIVEDPLPPEEALDMVGLTDRANNYPAQLSGGQQQRVSIARAIAKNPRLILADEPTAALDFASGQQVLVTIENIVHNYGKTVMMVTHNVEIAKMADRVIKLRAGRIASIKKNLKPLPATDIIW